MTRQDYTALVFVVDGSEAMVDYHKEATKTLESLRDTAVSENAKVTVDTVYFNDAYVQRDHFADPKEVDFTIYPNGKAAFYDSTARKIRSFGEVLAALPENERPGKVVFTIVASGRDDDSRVHTSKTISDLMQHQTDVYGWEFVLIFNSSLFRPASGGSKKLALHEKRNSQLETFFPNEDEMKVNDDGTLKFVDTTSEKEIERRNKLRKSVRNKFVATTVISGSPVPIGLAMLVGEQIMTSSITNPTFGIASMFIGIAGYFVTGMTLAGRIPKNMRPMVAIFTPHVTRWLKDSYGLAVDNKTAAEIAFRMLTWDDYQIRFSSTNKMDYQIFKQEDHWWVTDVQGRTLRTKQVKEQQVSVDKTPKAITSESTPNNQSVEFTPEVEEQENFLEKIALLRSQTLTPEQDYAVERAAQEAQQATAAATVLKSLGSDTYVETLKEVFTLMNTELDIIIIHKQEEMHSQLKMSKNILQERLHQTFTLAP